MIFKEILIAVDGSEFASHAADVGIALAKQLKARIAFVHVFNAAAGPGTTWGVPADTLMEMSEREAKRLLARFRERAGSRPVTDFLESGAPAEEIVKAAQKWSADLIVMGSHGRGKIGGLVLGSVSQGVLHHAPCPVLVVRTKR